MPEHIHEIVTSCRHWNTEIGFFQFGVVAFSLFVICWLSLLLGKTYLIDASEALIKKIYPKWLSVIRKYKVLYYLIHLIPGIILHLAAPFYISYNVVGKIILILADVYVVGVFGLTLNAVMSTSVTIYERFDVAKRIPIRTYIQIVKIILVIVCSLLSISILLETSFFAFFTGLGAAIGIIMLIFKDTILGFVSSIQVTFYDIARIGDRIVVPDYDADGYVEEISISTVKIRNLDKTITTMPTHSLVEKGVRNWRAMEDAGGRRIRRAINLDSGSIEFCTPAFIEKMQQIKILTGPIAERLKENEGAAHAELLTNLEAFRLYTYHYLRQHAGLHQEDYLFLVRYLAPFEFGVPLEIIVFTKETGIDGHEQVQSRIFEHLLAMLPTFGLSMYQEFSQLDMQPKSSPK